MDVQIVTDEAKEQLHKIREYLAGTLAAIADSSVMSSLIHDEIGGVLLVFDFNQRTYVYNLMANEVSMYKEITAVGRVEDHKRELCENKVCMSAREFTENVSLMAAWDL